MNLSVYNGERYKLMGFRLKLKQAGFLIQWVNCLQHKSIIEIKGVK
jgi:hypothetical protein